MADNKNLITEIDKVLDTVRPHLHVDGGDVEIVEVTDDMVLKVRWMGNCSNCAMSVMTMKAGIEEAVRRMVPQIKSVEAVNGITLA